MREKVERVEDQSPRKKVVVGGAFEVRLLIGRQLRARPGPISGGHPGLVRGRAAYLSGHPGPELKATYLGGSVLWRGLKRT